MRACRGIHELEAELAGGCEGVAAAAGRAAGAREAAKVAGAARALDGRAGALQPRRLLCYCSLCRAQSHKCRLKTLLLLEDI